MQPIRMQLAEQSLQPHGVELVKQKTRVVSQAVSIHSDFLQTPHPAGHGVQEGLPMPRSPMDDLLCQDWPRPPSFLPNPEQAAATRMRLLSNPDPPAHRRRQIEQNLADMDRRIDLGLPADLKRGVQHVRKESGHEVRQRKSSERSRELGEADAAATYHGPARSGPGHTKASSHLAVSVRQLSHAATVKKPGGSQQPITAVKSLPPIPPRSPLRPPVQPRTSPSRGATTPANSKPQHPSRAFAPGRAPAIAETPVPVSAFHRRPTAGCSSSSTDSLNVRHPKTLPVHSPPHASSSDVPSRDAWWNEAGLESPNEPITPIQSRFPSRGNLVSSSTPMPARRIPQIVDDSAEPTLSGLRAFRDNCIPVPRAVQIKVTERKAAGFGTHAKPTKTSDISTPLLGQHIHGSKTGLKPPTPNTKSIHIAGQYQCGRDSFDMPPAWKAKLG
jgi:hypothetical protein